MQIHAYLGFAGECEAAFEFYARLLGGEVREMVRFEHALAEDDLPPDARGKIMHASLVAGEAVLMGADSFDEHYQTPRGLWISLDVHTVAEAERIFAALSERGTVSMALEETFWAARFGQVTDRFGTPWMVSCPKRASST